MPQSSTNILFNNKAFPAFGWSVDIGTYGQLGRATIHTTVSRMQQAGIDLVALTSHIGKTVVTIDLNGSRVFGGNFTHAHGSLHENKVQLFCRDYASTLFDIKRSLADLGQLIGGGGAVAAGFLTLQKLVIGIAKLGGFTGQNLQFNAPDSVLSLPVGVSNTSQPNGSLATVPHTLWNILVYLARMSGCTVYTTPAGVLIFEQIALHPNSYHQYGWLMTPQQLRAPKPPLVPYLPVKDFDFLFQPERNKQFISQAITHNAQSTQTASSSVLIIDGEPFPLGDGTAKPRTYTGNAAGQIGSALSAKGLGLPIYTDIKDGETPADTIARAQANANDIASKLVGFMIVVTGDLSIRPLDKAVVTEGPKGAMLGFSGKTMYINSVSHHYDVPQGEGVGSSGFLTTLKCLSVPPPMASQADLDALYNANAGGF